MLHGLREVGHTLDALPVITINSSNAAPNGFAEEVKTADKPKRARNDKGQLVAVDPSNPDVNEAWEGGEAPE